MSKPRVGITIGDPAGIGPEVTRKALNSPEVLKNCVPVVIGDRHFIFGKKKLCGKLPFELVDMPYDNIFSVNLGEFSAETGLMSYHYVARAIELAGRKKIDAVVTAPVSKEAFRLAGIEYSGHTELFADFTKTEDYAMVMAAGSLRAVMVTRHIPLSYACKNISAENIFSTTLLARDFLVKKLGIKKPRIGICALNPHAGEGGLMGKEEEDFIMPAVTILKNKNINVTGPIPADSAWLKMKQGLFDLLVTMYHDQAMIPLKAVSNEKIVNITIGLPFVRTSPGHGTGFDIAGKNIADPRPMIEAIKTAAKLSRS